MESIYRRISNVLRVFGTRFSHVMTQKIGSDSDPYTILPVIPPELWLRIFRIVATAPASHKLYEIDYSPFYGLSENDRTVLKDAHWQRTRVVHAYSGLQKMEGIGARILVRGYTRGSRGLLEGLKRSGDRTRTVQAKDSTR